MKIFFLALLTVLLVASGGSQAEQPIEVELPSLEGDTVRLSDYRGQ